MECSKGSMTWYVYGIDDFIFDLVSGESANHLLGNKRLLARIYSESHLYNFTLSEDREIINADFYSMGRLIPDGCFFFKTSCLKGFSQSDFIDFIGEKITQYGIKKGVRSIIIE